MRRWGLTFAVLGLVAIAAGLWITRARVTPPDQLAGLTGDATRGAAVFWAAGCASCHKAGPDGDPLVLAGGQMFQTDFGVFHAPNISMDVDHGIGGWSVTDFASAVRLGTSPDGQHYYPAFPYASYARMTDADVVDLWAFFKTLPASDTPNLPHTLGFPFNLRASVGGWKWLYADTEFLTETTTPELDRGRYLVEALAHCGECHTPRTALGGLDESRWMDGAPNPSGQGRIPGLTPAHLDWSANDIAYYLETGFTPEFDSAGGSMADVVTNMGKLTAEDRAAIAAYIKALPG